jgi:hypothetical protein
VRTSFAAERLMDAPAEVIYHCIADYREHHRPGGFLPTAFSDFEILRGGVGSGTEYRITVAVGGRRRAMSASVNETAPGRELVETGPGSRTVFTVEPVDRGARVRFETVMEEDGLAGVMNRLFARRLLQPVYEDELRRLEEYARAHSTTPH